MPRPRSPQGKHVTMSVRVTEATAAAVDAARGDTSRAVWIEQAIAAKLDSRIRERLGVEIIVDDRQPPGIVSVIAPGDEVTEVRSFALAPEKAAPKLRNCKHPRVRVKGVCPDCLQPVGYK